MAAKPPSEREGTIYAAEHRATWAMVMGRRLSWS